MESLEKDISDCLKVLFQSSPAPKMTNFKKINQWEARFTLHIEGKPISFKVNSVYATSRLAAFIKKLHEIGALKYDRFILLHLCEGSKAEKWVACRQELRKVNYKHRFEVKVEQDMLPISKTLYLALKMMQETLKGQANANQ